MEIGQYMTVYVKALSNGEWFGGWAPVRAEMLWQAEDGRAALFMLLEEDLEEADEYEFWAPGSLLLAVQEEDGYRVRAGMKF